MRLKRLELEGAGSVVAVAAALAGLLGVTAGGCAEGDASFDDGETDTSSGTAASGGSDGGQGGQGGAGGEVGPCAVDCATIATPACQVARCNSATGQCEIVPDEDDVPCDDGKFCTVDDTCQAGQCTGGPPNDCGMQADACQEILCDETTQSCSQQALANGTSCQTADLCITGSTCQNGLCLGGSLNECFFFPVPDGCHVATCNPMNGVCEAVVGNEGLACTDPNDLCTVGKTCASGVCQGGAPKDCSHLTEGCFNGVCDTATGQCTQQQVMMGQSCLSAADQCNNGICDSMGNCNPDPLPNGTACNDHDGCTTVDTCQNGVCTGMNPITQCGGGDLCCPSGCTIAQDPDCNPTPITLDAIHRGWWNSSGSHTASNNNTITGHQSIGDYNSYFIFDLSGVTGTIINAELRLEIEGYSSPDPSEGMSVWDVSTPSATLEASGSNIAIYQDLESGTQYGTFTVLSTDLGNVLTIPLNASAVSDIQSKLGTDVAVGVHLDTVGSTATQWVRFSFGSEARTHQLVVYVL